MQSETALVHAFRTIAEAADYAIVMLEPDGRIASWSSAAARLFRRSAAETLGRPASILLRTDVAIERDLALAAAGGQPDHELVLTRGDGSAHLARILLTATRGPAGELVGYVLVVRVVTDEPRVRGVAEKYAEAFEHADIVLRSITEGVIVQDGTGGILYANDAAARICGFDSGAALMAAPPSEVIARFEVTDASGVPIDLARLPGRRALAGETPEPLLIRVRSRATGATWWSLVRANAIRDEQGRPELAINVWHDVTAEERQKRASRILADATRRLGASIEYESTLAAVAQSLVPEVADWSSVDLIEDGARRRLAVAHADPAKVAYARELAERYPPDPNASTGVPRVLRTGKAELYTEIPPELLRANAVDEEHWRVIQELGLRSAMVVPIPVDGRTAGALSLIAAESDRRYDEHDLALACEIGRRAGTAIEHARAYGAAQRAIHLRDEFLSVAGHELRTPLAALSLQLEILKQAGDPAKQAARVEKAIGQVERMSKLIEELLDVTRVSSGRLELSCTTFDLSELVREVAERFTETAARSRSRVEVQADVPATGSWDMQRLDQVVTNLLTNAIKYGAGAPVVIRCQPAEDHVVLTVQDEGIGIAAEHHGRIFERFERAVPQRNYGGLGLGLWIVREVVTAHGGRVAVTSEPGKGSRFAVVLPRRR